MRKSRDAARSAIEAEATAHVSIRSSKPIAAAAESKQLKLTPKQLLGKMAEVVRSVSPLAPKLRQTRGSARPSTPNQPSTRPITLPHKQSSVRQRSNLPKPATACEESTPLRAMTLKILLRVAKPSLSTTYGLKGLTCLLAGIYPTLSVKLLDSHKTLGFENVCELLKAYHRVASLASDVRGLIQQRLITAKHIRVLEEVLRVYELDSNSEGRVDDHVGMELIGFLRQAVTIFQEESPMLAFQERFELSPLKSKTNNQETPTSKEACVSSAVRVTEMNACISSQQLSDSKGHSRNNSPFFVHANETFGIPSNWVAIPEDNNSKHSPPSKGVKANLIAKVMTRKETTTPTSVENDDFAQYSLARASQVTEGLRTVITPPSR